MTNMQEIHSKIYQKMKIILMYPALKRLILFLSLTLVCLSVIHVWQSLDFQVRILGKSKTHILQQQLQRNDKRVEQAMEYLNDKRYLVKEFNTSDTRTVDLAITIRTVRRNLRNKGSEIKYGDENNNYDPNYLAQSVSKLLKLLLEIKHDGLKYRVRLVVCNVDKLTSTANGVLSHISQFVKVIDKYSGDQPKGNEKGKLKEEPIAVKHRHDYKYCLNATMQV